MNYGMKSLPDFNVFQKEWLSQKDTTCLDVWIQCEKLEMRWRKKKMAIARFEYYESCLDPHTNGDYVKYEDHLEAIERLEYELRAMEEEMRHWKEKYFEYYEQDQL